MRRLLTRLASLGAIGWCASSATALGSGAAKLGAGSAEVVCGPSRARTLAGDAQARVYSLGHSVYGCTTTGRRPHRLAGAGVEACLRAAEIGAISLAGAVAAYALRTCGIDTGSAEVVVRSLDSGRQLSVHAAIVSTTGAESFQTVGSIVLEPGGPVAWIASSSSIATHRRSTEVVAVTGKHMRVLDSGSGIDIRSLDRAGSTVTWLHGGARRSARLGR